MHGACDIFIASKSGELTTSGRIESRYRHIAEKSSSSKISQKAASQSEALQGLPVSLSIDLVKNLVLRHKAVQPHARGDLTSTKTSSFREDFIVQSVLACALKPVSRSHRVESMNALKVFNSENHDILV